jgi:crotonobetainyl-CoA:carnitine CoA-transferase CaiB-like acyl-CoA transferase
VHPNIAPYQPFRAADGWFNLAAGTEGHWKAVVALLDAQDSLGSDPRFATNRDRVAHRDALELELERRFAEKPVAAWIDAFEGAGVPCGPILSPNESLQHPHLLAREMVIGLEHAAAGHVRSLGNPMKLSRTPATYRTAAPTLGQHTGEILEELGYTAEQIVELGKQGFI